MEFVRVWGNELQRFSVAELPELPDGSLIRIGKADDGAPRLVLDVPMGFMERWGLPFFVRAVMMGVLGCGASLFIGQLQQKPPWPMMIFAVVMLVGFAAAGCVLLRLVWGLITGEEPESLSLCENELQFDPGTLDRFPGLNAEAVDLRRLWRRPGVQTRPRGAARVELRRFDARQALLVIGGDEWLEVGRFLREPEREWLFDVLRAWTEQDASDESPRVAPVLPVSESLRDQPRHLECRREGSENLRFILRSPEQDRERTKMALIFGGFLCAWSGFGVWSMWLLLQGQPGIITLYLKAWLAGWLFGEVLMVWTVAGLQRSRESVVLTEKGLEHDLGCYQWAYQMQNEALWKGPRRRRMFVPREAVAEMRLESIGPRERLTFDLGADRIEVGRFLTPSDRRILQRVLYEYVEKGLEGAEHVRTAAGLESGGM